ncbi:MAG: Mth938-like domain-containing protein [Gammaproteobacteria bacterium]|jgi:uncharacterized protein
MKFTEEVNESSFVIHAYEAGFVNVNETLYRSSLIVSPNFIKPDWRPETFEELCAEDLAPVLELQPEILLIGTGGRHQFPHPQILRDIYAAGIGVEIMETGAACRTYNILMAEGRRVAAALLMI